ncbi:uncharacterized protein [Temnothorax nylanderi]|uniref:uncharacterized protein n=1 Tax=Temnothorax nylanderi TaxID=102681 RepID=UPI003A8896EC
MSDPINATDTNMNNNLPDVNDKVTGEKSVLASKMCTEDDVKEWSIVYFESDEEEDIEGFNDLIPSSWITNMGALSWYPMAEHKATIRKLVKQCVKADLKWNCFCTQKIQEGIENYDQGMKMLIKIAKYPNAKVYLDMEEKGKGKRLKKPIKHFESDKENFEKRRKLIPPIPKLSSKSRTNRPLSDTDKVEKMEINVREISKNKDDDIHCEEVKLSKESSFCTEVRKSKPNTATSEGICNSPKFSLSAKGCKIHKKSHRCAYTSEGEVTLESVADAVCYLNAEMLLCKQDLRKTDKNLESFLETEMMTKKPTTEKPTITAVHILDEFPITNLDDLKEIEHRLKKDETFYSEVVNALHLSVMGESVQKKVNSVLRMVLDDKLASLFNWKGQRGTKLKLSKRRITKVMIDAVTKEFPTINETMFGRKAGPWLAQATFRMKKHIGNNNEAHSDDDDDDSENCNKSSDESNEEKNDEEKNLP